MSCAGAKPPPARAPATERADAPEQSERNSDGKAAPILLVPGPDGVHRVATDPEIFAALCRAQRSLDMRLCDLGDLLMADGGANLSVSSLSLLRGRSRDSPEGVTLTHRQRLGIFAFLRTVPSRKRKHAEQQRAQAATQARLREEAETAAAARRAVAAAQEEARRAARVVAQELAAKRQAALEEAARAAAQKALDTAAREAARLGEQQSLSLGLSAQSGAWLDEGAGLVLSAAGSGEAALTLHVRVLGPCGAPSSTPLELQVAVVNEDFLGVGAPLLVGDTEPTVVGSAALRVRLRGACSGARAQRRFRLLVYPRRVHGAVCAVEPTTNAYDAARFMSMFTRASPALVQHTPPFAVARARALRAALGAQHRHAATYAFARGEGELVPSSEGQPARLSFPTIRLTCSNRPVSARAVAGARPLAWSTALRRAQRARAQETAVDGTPDGEWEMERVLAQGGSTRCRRYYVRWRRNGFARGQKAARGTWERAECIPPRLVQAFLKGRGQRLIATPGEGLTPDGDSDGDGDSQGVDGGDRGGHGSTGARMGGCGSARPGVASPNDTPSRRPCLWSAGGGGKRVSYRAASSRVGEDFQSELPQCRATAEAGASRLTIRVPLPTEPAEPGAAETDRPRRWAEPVGAAEIAAELSSGMAVALTAAALGPMSASAFVDETDSAGLGLFARVPALRGERICEYSGPRLPLHRHKKGRFVLGVPREPVVIDAMSENSPYVLEPTPGAYANHSARPNAKLHCVHDRAAGLRRIWLVATERIDAGAEVRIDYEDGAQFEGAYWLGAPPAETAWRQARRPVPPGSLRDEAPPPPPPMRWDGPSGGDARLPAIVSVCSKNWSLVATHLPGRTPSQCRQRWRVLCRRARPDAAAAAGAAALPPAAAVLAAAVAPAADTAAADTPAAAATAAAPATPDPAVTSTPAVAAGSVNGKDEAPAAALPSKRKASASPGVRWSSRQRATAPAWREGDRVQCSFDVGPAGSRNMSLYPCAQFAGTVRHVPVMGDWVEVAFDDGDVMRIKTRLLRPEATWPQPVEVEAGAAPRAGEPQPTPLA